jgi:hypothetical protein
MNISGEDANELVNKKIDEILNQNKNSNENYKLLDIKYSFSDLNREIANLRNIKIKVLLEYIVIILCIKNIFLGQFATSIISTLIIAFLIVDSILSVIKQLKISKSLYTIFAVLKETFPDYNEVLMEKSDIRYKTYNAVIEKEKQERIKKDLKVKKAFKNNSLYDCLNKYIEIYGITVFDKIFVDSFFEKYEQYSDEPIKTPETMIEKCVLISTTVLNINSKDTKKKTAKKNKLFEQIVEGKEKENDEVNRKEYFKAMKCKEILESKDLKDSKEFEEVSKVCNKYKKFKVEYDNAKKEEEEIEEMRKRNIKEMERQRKLDEEMLDRWEKRNRASPKIMAYCKEYNLPIRGFYGLPN